MGDSPVLTLGDATLYANDIAQIDYPCWFNDSLITFFLEHVAREYDTRRRGVVLVPPNLAYFLAIADDPADVAASLRALSAHLARAVVVVVNNALTGHASLSPSGGNHWSVLVCSRASTHSGSPSFTAYDSLAGRPNRAATTLIASRLTSFFRDEARAPINDGSMNTSGQNTRDAMRNGNVELAYDTHAPLQTNSCDCGPYACAYIQAIAQTDPDDLFRPKPEASGSLAVDLTEADATCMRQKLRAAVESYVAER